MRINSSRRFEEQETHFHPRFSLDRQTREKFLRDYKIPRRGRKNSKRTVQTSQTGSRALLHRNNFQPRVR